MADELGERAICVILSGTGGDGSLGLKAVKEKGRLVIAQDPDEAEYDGMPRSAIMSWPTWNCPAPFRLHRFPRHISVGE